MITIAIPTYNRNKILRKNLLILLPKVTTHYKIIIIDNHSDVPVYNDIKDVLKNFNHLDITVVRNKFNVGMTANIMKCYELCDTKWLWILGDDDEVTNNALDIIYSDTQTYKDYHFITYAWDKYSFKRSGEYTAVGCKELIKYAENFGVILYLSTSLYNMDYVSKGVSFGNFFQSSYAPHLATLFMSLGCSDKSLISGNAIVKNTGYDIPDNLKWDQIFIYQLTLLLRLPLPPSTLEELKKKLSLLTRQWTISHFIFHLTVDYKFPGDNSSNYILYNEIVNSFYSLDKRLTTKIISFFGSFIISYPKLFAPLLKYLYFKISGNKYESQRTLRI